MSDFDTSKFLREGLKKINFSQIESAIKKDGVEGLISQKDNLINTLTEHATKTGFDYVDLGIETLTDSIATYLGATGQEGPAVGIVVLKDLAKIGFENFMKSTGVHRKKLQPGDYCAVLRGYQTFRELDKFIQDGREGLYLDKPTQKNIEVAIVMSRIDENTLEILDLNLGTKENIPEMDCAPFTNAQLTAVKGTEFEKVRDLVMRKELGIEKLNKPTSGQVIYEGQLYEIKEDAEGDRMVVIENETGMKKVNRNDLEFAWTQNSNTDSNTPGFVQSGHDIVAGEFVYAGEALVCVHSMLDYEYYVCNCWDGKFSYCNIEVIERVNQSNFVGPVFTKFKLNVLEGNQRLLEEDPISKHFPNLCVKKFYHSDGKEFPAVTIGNVRSAPPVREEHMRFAPKSDGPGVMGRHHPGAPEAMDVDTKKGDDETSPALWVIGGAVLLFVAFSVAK